MNGTQHIIDPHHDPLMQPIQWNNKEYRTSHFLHREYRANSQHGGKYQRHSDFLRLLKGIETYQDYVKFGDIVYLSSWRWVREYLDLKAKTAFTNEIKTLHESFIANDHKPLYLVNATIQVALSHHLDDELNKQLSVTANTATARELTGHGRLPVEQAERTYKSVLNIGRMMNCSPHILHEFAVKRVLLDTGVDLQPLLSGAPAMHEVQADETMLEPEDLAKKLDIRSGILMNKFLAQIGWQHKPNPSSPWKPTQAGERYCVIHPWMKNGKSGYNYKWNVEAVRNELKRRNMLPPTAA